MDHQALKSLVAGDRFLALRVDQPGHGNIERAIALVGQVAIERRQEFA